MDSYTIVLVVLTLRTTQTARGWLQQTSFLGGVQSSNGGFRPCEGPGLARISGLLVDSLIMLARYFSVDFATCQPLRSQHSPVISSLDCNHGLPPFRSLILAHSATPHPFVITRDTTSLVQLLRFSILFGGKLYEQLQVLEVV